MAKKKIKSELIDDSNSIKVKKIDLEALEKEDKKREKKKTKSKTKVTGKHASKEVETTKVKKKEIKEAKHVKKDHKAMTIFMIVFTVICLCGFIYSGYKIFKWKDNLDENEDIQEVLNDNIKEENDEDGNPVFYIDFNALKELNKDTVAYIDFKQFSISYVIVKTDNNDYYLDHNFNRKWNEAGWIFADYRNKLDGTDKNIIIYGHSMRNGSMFGSLHNILKNEEYKNEENKTFKYATEEGTYTYKVFSIYTIEAEDYYITTDFDKNIKWNDFIKTIKDRSIYNYNVDVKEDDTIITLSTCQGYVGDKRMVLHAVKLKEE